MLFNSYLSLSINTGSRSLNIKRKKLRNNLVAAPDVTIMDLFNTVQTSENAKEKISDILEVAVEKAWIPTVSASSLMSNQHLEFGSTPSEIAPSNDNAEMPQVLVQAATTAASIPCPTAFRELYNACRENKIEMAKSLISTADVDINQMDNHDKLTPLLLTIKKSHLVIARMLLEAGANANFLPRFGYPALLIACSNNDLVAVKLLIEFGADVELKDDRRHHSPLQIACDTNFVEVVRELVSAGANIDSRIDFISSLWIQACQHGHIEIMQIFIKNGIDVNCDYGGHTALYEACDGGDYRQLEAVKLLLANGADINKGHTEEKSPIMAIDSDTEYPDVLQELIKAGANVNHADKQGRSVLWMACYDNNIAAIPELLQAGANINKSDQQMRTPLIIACTKNNTEIAKMLLEAGAIVDTADKHQRTPLRISCDNKKYRVGEAIDSEWSRRRRERGVFSY